ncbi:MAG: hypothetical protein Q8R79_01765 [Legionellaceae bacterium]|nr:hypothetical protein [Legionellaceae bacterium]
MLFSITCTRNEKIQFYFQLLGSVFSAGVLLSIFLPELYVFFKSLLSGQIYMFVNAWDEETYLSYQGAMGARNIPGYYGLYLVTTLHQLGLSGAIQHLIFDLVLIPTTVFFTMRSVRFFVNDNLLAFFYAIIILFSSVLFNYGNPLIAWLYGGLHLSTIICGWESYPSFIRAPNPLFSDFVLSVCIFMFLKTKKKWFLLLPLSILYYFVFQPYLYCLSVATISFLFNKRNSTKYIILFNFVSFFIISIVAYIAYINTLSSADHEVLNGLLGSTHIQFSRKVYLPLYTIVGFILFGASSFLGILKRPFVRNSFITLILCSFFISNIQIVTGLAVEIKNFQDYGNSLIVGFMLVLFLESLRTHEVRQNNNFLLHKTISIIILMLIAFCSSFQFAYRMYGALRTDYQHRYFTKEQLLKIKNMPMAVLILDDDMSAKISYSQSKMPAIMTSYTMSFPALFRQCTCFYSRAEKAKKYLKTVYGIDNPVTDAIVLDMSKYLPIKGNEVYCREICAGSNSTKFMVFRFSPTQKMFVEL